jgi:hypothetical protein
VLNSAGNMVGIIPKNFLIALVKNHKWLDESKLTKRQKMKLPRMYRKLSHSNEVLDETGSDAFVRERNRKGAAKTIITQNDWFMREFGNET